MAGPHDKLVKYACSDVEEARPLLRSVLPTELAAEVEWTTLELVPGSFVDSALSERHTDLLFTAQVGGTPTLLYLLVEHQSTVDRFMAYRVHRYVGRIWDRWLRDHEGARKLARVVPIVLHTGKDRWDAPSAVEALVQGEPAPWVPRMSFLLVDLAGASDEALAKRALKVFGELVLRAVVRLPWSRDPLREIQRWADLLRHLLATPSGVERFVAVLEYLSRIANIHLADLQHAIRELSPADEEKVMTTLAERMEKHALLKGEVKGQIRGQMKVILQLLRLKFEALPETTVAKVEAGTEADFERWAERLLRAQRLEQVFNDEPLP